jgi:two-component system LytT family response regulator
VNSIDYLLKPIKKDELKNAIDKFMNLAASNSNKSVDFDKLVGLLKPQQEFQKRIIIRFGDTIVAVEIKDVAYFYTEQKVNFLHTFSGKNYPIDQNLDQIDGMTDPAVFFRINRQFIVNINAIKKMLSYSKSRVKLLLEPPTEHETIVSTERSPHFKQWLTGTRD